MTIWLYINKAALLFKILKIEGGVDVLDTKPFGLAYAYDKFKENNKKLELG